VNFVVNLKKWRSEIKKLSKKLKKSDPELAKWMETHVDVIIGWYETNNREMTPTDLGRLMSANMQEVPTWAKESK
jgi:hypothetical protein